MVREDKSLAYEEYFWQDVELDGKVILDAGTGFGVTTSEIASRMKLQRLRGRIISVDIDQNLPSWLENVSKNRNYWTW